MTIAVIGICTVFFCLFLLYGVYSLTGWLFTRKSAGSTENAQAPGTEEMVEEEKMVMTIDRAANSSNWNPASAKTGGSGPAAAPAVRSHRSTIADLKPEAAVNGPAVDPRKITSPLPGLVLSIDVAKGDSVRKGQKVAVIEAMKMENEILAGKDGIIGKICVAKGDTILEGATLIEFEN